jgi:hypothetical protein
MLHCNIKRKRQRCAKLPRTFDGQAVAPIAIGRLDTPQACNWREDLRPAVTPARAADRPRILLIFH